MSEHPGVGDPRFAVELVKLLLQAVWADGEVSPEEAEAIHDFAVRSGVSAGDVEMVDAGLTGLGPLPVPNLGLLKGHRTEVLRAVGQLLKADQRMHEDEEALLADISTLLD